MIIGEKINAINASLEIGQFYFDDDDDDDDDNQADESFLKPVYLRTKLFTIDSTSKTIFCNKCNMSDHELIWKQTFDLNQHQYFGLSQRALPANQQSLLISHDHNSTDSIEENDIFFIRRCSDTLSIVYHPLSIPRPIIGDNEHPLARFNGIWLGSYGGHGLELLCFELCHEFTCLPTVDGRSKDSKIVPNALVARKISGDPNVPHSQISFAAIQQIEVDSNGPICYEGIGQSKEKKKIEFSNNIFSSFSCTYWLY